MAAPATTGRLCATIGEMEIGDYIVWKYDGTQYIMDDSIAGYTEIPTGGLLNTSSLTEYYLYAIKVNKGLLVCDRNRYNTLSWDNLNTQKLIQGTPTLINGIVGTSRVLSGGCAYSSVNGHRSLADTGHGAWPQNNEWDRYIKNFPVDKIQQTKTLDDIFHFLNIFSWCQETPINGTWTNIGGATATAGNTGRITRGNDSYSVNSWKGTSFNPSSLASSVIGYRPVFEYSEV